MSREQIVRDTAYAIWEAEGKPEGRDSDHWSQAEARIAAGPGSAGSMAKEPARGKATTRSTDAVQAKTPAKVGAGKAAASKAKKG